MTLVPQHIKNLSPYKPGKRIEEVQSKYNLDKIVKLASNENPLGPSPLAIKNVLKCIKDTHRYPDSSGYSLRKTLASNFNLNIENVILGNGSEGIMSAIIRTFLNENDELISAEDSFIGFRVLANASGRKVNWVKMKNYTYDLKSIACMINEKTKIIYLANPDNPTGTYFTKKEFEKFMSIVPERVLVIMDEAYFEFAQSIDDFPDSMSYRYDNVITLRTFSKSYGLAGFRVGYGFAHHHLIENLLKVKLPFEPSIPAQAAALGALNDKEHLNSTIKNNKLGMEFIINNLSALNIDFIPSVANFVTVDFKEDTRAVNFVKLMLENGVILRGLGSFGLPSCVRISIGTMDENRIFADKMNCIINEL